MARAGERLSDAEVAELLSYDNQGLSRPEKFDGLVYDNSYGPTQGYRWPTVEETIAAKEAAVEQERAVKASADLDAKARKEFASRNRSATPPPPPPPSAS